MYRERDPQKREDFIESIKDIPKEEIVYVDESGIDEFFYRKHARALRGHKIIAEISGKRFERQSIVAAKCGKEILAPFGYPGTCDSKLFNFWIENVLINQLKKGQTIVMDNAKIHKTEKTKKLIENAGCNIIFLPPYSPDLNPIEHTWSHMKKNVRANMKLYSSLKFAVQNFFS
jgi:transposase